MNRTLQPARALFAIGLLGLGVLGLVYHDFALDWQPVPLWVPGRTFLAYGSGVLMLACGAGVLFRSTAVWAVRILFPYLFLWMLLKVPLLFVAPGLEAVWLGFGEVVMLMTGGWVLWAIFEEVPPGSPLAPIAGHRGFQRALVAFGLALLLREAAERLEPNTRIAVLHGLAHCRVVPCEGRSPDRSRTVGIHA